MKANANAYKHIQAWGESMGSFGYYIVAQQELAVKESAPLNAIYKDAGGWRTADDIYDTSKREQINNRSIELAGLDDHDWRRS